MPRILTFDLGTTLFEVALFDERVPENSPCRMWRTPGASAEIGRLAFEAIVNEYSRFLRYFKQQPIPKQLKE
jgi:hypothetical protein